MVGKEVGAKKRPSVETEGRLTIACHMKILQKIDVGGAGLNRRHKDNDPNLLREHFNDTKWLKNA
jgi:hypothetical protein